MGQELPKQFLSLNGKPVLAHTLEKFSQIADEIILVLTPSHIGYWKEELAAMGHVTPHTIIPGGATRSESVQNGLAALPDDGIVAVHDAVRPLVSPQLITLAYTEAAIHGSAVPVTEVRDSLREKVGDNTIPADRSRFLAVQTPQCFSLRLLKEAYKLSGGNSFTDDATVFGNAGNKVHTIPGEQGNIKITYPEDLTFATAVTAGKV